MSGTNEETKVLRYDNNDGRPRQTSNQLANLEEAFKQN